MVLLELVVVVVIRADLAGCRTGGGGMELLLLVLVVVDTAMVTFRLLPALWLVLDC